jgi:hypothetical protein
MLVYANQEYDPEDPWNGLFRSRLLVWVGTHSFVSLVLLIPPSAGIQTHLHLTQFRGERGESNEIRQCSYSWNDTGHHGFLSIHSYPGASGVGAPPNSPLNVRQLRFALSSSSVFCRTDTSTDSERFYESVLDFLDHPEEKDEVHDLLSWWNW